MSVPFLKRPAAALLAALAAMAAPLPALAVDGITDRPGDFLATFAGSASSLDLDVIAATVTYNPGTNIFTFSSTQSGAVGLTSTGFYVWGVNRGAGTAGFAANGLPGVLFDRVMILRPDGTGSIGATALPAGSVLISSNTISASVSGTLLPSTGFALSNYTFNLWPRDGAAGAGFAQISDFAPDNSNFTATVVPEPGSLVLMSLGLAAGLLWRRRSSAISEAAGSPRS
jgi:hypothetical protein